MIRVSCPSVGREESAAVEEAFALEYFGQGLKTAEFEQRLKDYFDGREVVTVNTGTSALHLSLAALGLGPEDEVIVPSLTFIGSWQAVTMTGAKVVGCEVRLDNLNIDIADVRRRITSRTRAIMPVHYAGRPCDMEELLSISHETGIRIVEDAAHALGSSYQGRRIGSFGDVACFSFDSIKNITCGDGGAIVTGDVELAERMRRMRLLGIDRKSHFAAWQNRSWFYTVNEPGFRYHLGNINAAIGLAQLAKLEGFIKKRQDICRRYDQALADMAEIATLAGDYHTTAPHVYVIRVLNGRRDQLQDHLKSLDIETGINYVPNHIQPFYAHLKLDLPVTETVFKEILTLPLHVKLSDTDVERVIAGVRGFFTS
ncbi:MAG: DegT/DnrJ/EryC1/StrS family aminotransferase [Deltaproteobacteria bacterium]|nr:DegT/DnrJ/EryC1/StrS family aminotransferase [Deltaproteobacteria bacterium]